MSAPQSTVRDRRTSVVLNVMLVVFAWLAVCAIAAFEFGLWPRTLVGWAVIVGVGPLAWIAAQAAGELAIRLVFRLPWLRRSSDWVERRTQRQQFSMLRVGFALLGGVALLAVVVLLWVYDESLPGIPGAVKQFVARHFQ